MPKVFGYHGKLSNKGREQFLKFATMMGPMSPPSQGIGNPQKRLFLSGPLKSGPLRKKSSEKNELEGGGVRALVVRPLRKELPLLIGTFR